MIWILTTIITAGLIIAITVMWARSYKKVLDNQKTIKESKWLMIGIIIGAGMGIPLGLTFNNIALGIPLGMGPGIAIGVALQQQLGKDKKLTPKLRKEIWKSIKMGLTTMIAGIITFTTILLIYG